MIGTSTLAWTLGLSALLALQGGNQGPRMDNSVQSIDRAISVYLNGEHTKSILTPGEFNEWPLTLKAGQVVIGEASSDAFDPALEIVDDTGKVLATNDDRYPGEQRPLLLWRCGADGAYALHVRSYNNKAGGQFFVRFKIYQSITVGSQERTEGIVDATKPFLVRVPMKAGQVKDLVAEKRGGANYINFNFGAVIVPNGLPERSPSFAQNVYPALRALIAPADGDYYLMANPYGYRGGNGRVRIGTRDIVPTALVPDGKRLTGKAPTLVPSIWTLPIKVGELLEVSTPELSLGCTLVVAEALDFSKVDLTKLETNPFFPQWKDTSPGPTHDMLPGRARDGRITVFRARRDAQLWLTSNGEGPAGGSFSVRVRPAAAEYAEEKTNTGRLQIGNSDYWAFDAQAGDVMSLDSKAAGFAAQIIVRDPDLAEVRHTIAAPDQTSDNWRMIVQKPGRYLVAVSCLGDGGGGEYSLSRKVFHAKEFAKGTPAKGEVADGQIQVWKFTATPDAPLLIHWSSTNWSYEVAIYDDKGQRTDFQRQDIDAQNRYGILKVSQPQTYVIVLTGKGDKASYTIQLNPIPGQK